MKKNPFLSTSSCSCNPRLMQKTKLICFPYAGGGGAVFRHWDKQFFGDVDIVPVCLPGRDQRFLEAAETDMKILILRLASELQDEMAGEFVFYGISAGAMVAYELACYLQEQGLPTPSQLFVACCDAPHLRSSGTSIHHLEDDALLDAVVSRYGNGGMDLQKEPELKALMLPALRADIKLAENYRGTQRPTLDIPITTLGAKDDSSVSAARLAQWQGLTDSDHSMHWLSGGHFLQSSERELSALIGTSINRI